MSATAAHPSSLQLGRPGGQTAADVSGGQARKSVQRALSVHTRQHAAGARDVGGPFPDRQSPGVRGSTLSIPGQSDCSPVRWWDGAPETTVLANCTSSDSWYTSSLWRVPIDGGTPTALTAPNNGKNGGRDLGDVNAWQLPAGAAFRPLARAAYLPRQAQRRRHHNTGVGARRRRRQEHPGDRRRRRGLDLQTQAACGGGQSLLRYDPASDTSTVLLGPPVNGGGVMDAVPFAGRR